MLIWMTGTLRLNYRDFILSKIDPLTSMSLQHFSLQWIVITDIIKILLEPFVVNMYYY